MIKINIKFLVFIVIIAIFAYLGGENLSYSILYSVVLVFIFGLIHVSIQMITMKVKLNVWRDVYKVGDVLNLDIVVKNFSVFPAAYMIVKNGAISNFKNNYKGDATFLNCEKEKYFSNKLGLNVRGIYDFSITNIVFTDLFCIVKAKKRFTLAKYIKIYPKIYRINESNFNERNIGISEYSNEIRDLRLYQDGDSLKRIHWKLSAKHNQLYVKNFAEDNSKDINLILNMSTESCTKPDNDLVEEQMIDLAVSMINYLQIKKFKIKLFINNLKEKIYDIGNHDEFLLLMEYFLNNKSEGENNLITYIDSKIKILKQKSWIGIITIVVNEALIQKVMALINIGFKISVFYSRQNDLVYVSEHVINGLEFIKFNEVIMNMDE